MRTNPIHPIHGMQAHTGWALSAVAGVTVVAGCSTAAAGSPHPAGPPPSTQAPPAHSAATACRDFGLWWLTTASGKHITGNAVLRKSVAEAPSGQLYHEMSTVQQNVTALAGMSGSIAQASRNLIITQVYNVITSDCASVNPNGG